MRRLTLGALLTLAAALAYLLAWPVPIEPRAWQAPPDPGHAGLYGGDRRLRHVTPLALGAHAGPEDLALRGGRLYASVDGGRIVSLRPDGRDVTVFATTGGRPLGIEFDDDGTLWVANAESGLQRIDQNGNVTTVLDTLDGQPLAYLNDVAVAADGRLYVSQSTTRFDPAQAGGTYAASLLDLLEHGDSGRVLEFDPATGEARVFAEGFSFANGVAVTADQRAVLLSETGSYRIWRLARDGGERRVIVDALPDFPDNLNNGLNDRVWVGLIAPRNALLDRLSGRPFLRRIVLRLPEALRPQAEPHGHLLAIDSAGNVLMNLQGDGLAAVTGAVESPRALYLSTLFGPHAGRLDKARLAEP